MADPNELKAALERLLAGIASDADRNALRTALRTGVLVTGERAVAIGGNASDVLITTGDQNIVLSFKGADAATVQEALSSIAPTRLHQVPPPPADFTGRKDELHEFACCYRTWRCHYLGFAGPRRHRQNCAGTQTR